MVEVEVTDEFIAWYEALSDGDAEQVDRYVALLERHGVTLRYPYSSDVKGSKYALRELRVQSGGRPLRIFYAFDPKRMAILLFGGDKTGDARFYEKYVPIERWVAQETLKMNLRELRKQLGVTQKELSKRIKMAQSELSRTERRSDHMLSTLRDYVEGLGGRLEIRAVFDDKQVDLYGV